MSQALDLPQAKAFLDRIDEYGAAGEEIKRLKTVQKEAKAAIEAELKRMNSASGSVFEAQKYKATWDQRWQKKIDLKALFVVAKDAFWDLVKPKLEDIELTLRPDEIGKVLTTQKADECTLTISAKKRVPG